MPKFKRMYSEDHSPRRRRDRFELELNEEERQEFLDFMRLIGEYQNASAAKQAIKLALSAISREGCLAATLRDTLFKNYQNAARLGTDPNTEIDNIIRTQNDEMGRKLR